MKAIDGRESGVRGSRGGFTLIELMVVVALMVILAGLTVGISGWVQRKAAVSKAETQLKLLETQLENYRSDNGGFPYPEPDGIDREGFILYKALFGDGVGPDHLAGTEDDTKTDGQPDEGARIYIAELDPGSNSLGMVESIGGRPPTRVLDPFGFTWRYRSGEHEKAMNPDFDLWSPGPDGADDTADDIRNW